MRRVIIKPVRVTAAAKKELEQIDFADCFAFHNREDELEKICATVFAKPKGWVGALFKIREFLGALVGLKVEMDKKKETTEELDLGFFNVYHKEEKEIIIGADDKHLNFRAVLMKTDDPRHNIELVTLVKFHNRFGRIYMSLIKPFHVIVVRAMAKRASKPFLNAEVA